MAKLTRTKLALISLFSLFGILNGVAQGNNMKVNKSFINQSINEKEFDQFIQDTMKKAGSLGLALAIIEDGKIVYSKGYGTTDLSAKNKVTPNTLMMIGAVTIPLTSALLATFVDDNKLKFDEPVTHIYPSFELSNPALTKKITLQELISGTSSVARRDIPFVANYHGQNEEDLFKELKSMPLNSNRAFEYQNQTPAALGYILAHQAFPTLSMHQGYTKLMQERIFNPLLMSRTTFNFHQALSDQNHASPHWIDVTGQPIAIDENINQCLDYVTPTGNAWSTVIDLAKYIIAELNEGMSYEGIAIMSKASTLYRRKPQVYFDIPENRFSSLDIAKKDAYALGWIIKNENDRKLIQHSGNAFGYASHVSFYPEDNKGIVILANNFHDYIVENAIQKKLSHLWFNNKDDSSNYLNNGLISRKNVIKKLYQHAPNTKLLEQYIGTFHNDDIGKWEITKVEKDFVLICPHWQSKLSTYLKSDGSDAIIGLDGILTWIDFEMIPQDSNHSFDVTLRNEKYHFTRV